MRNLFLFFLITLLTGSPVFALLVILAVYLALDYQFIGISRRLLGRFRRAGMVRALNRELSVNPHDATARRDLGRILIEARRFGEAVPHLEKAMDRMPDSDETVCDLGLAYLWTGKVTEGENLIRKAMERSPKLRYGEPYLRWGEFLLHRGRADEAAQRLEQFRSIFSSSVEGHYLLGMAYQRAGDRTKAVLAYRTALEMFKRSPRYKRREERLWAWKTRARLWTV
ncbi:MAG TPA: tetratricopeptide repeat protein [Nitrospiria bacterium]|jgi:tetratricopeptide (TPR) repeat protein|nr:tetratricopeptide repeat protein [Nitrospiria bacterium]